MNESETLILTPERDNRWMVKTLEYELRLLKREHEHLTKKRRTRPLTRWESQRMKDLRSESRSVFLKLGAYQQLAVLPQQN